MPLVVTFASREFAIAELLSTGAPQKLPIIFASSPRVLAHLVIRGEFVILEAHETSIEVNEVPVLRGRALFPDDVLKVGGHMGRVSDVETSLPLNTADLALAILKQTHGKEVPTVLVVEGTGIGDALDLRVEGRAYVVGRGRANDFRIDDSSVSREHLRVLTRQGRVFVRDLESAHGSFLGSDRLEPKRDAEWATDKALRVGSVVLRLRLAKTVSEAVQELVETVSRGEHTPSVQSERSAAAILPMTFVSASVVATPKRAPTKSRSIRQSDRIVLGLGSLLVLLCVSALVWLMFGQK